MSIISVLIVDDSALVRKLLTKVLESDPDINVVGTAADPYIAREKIKALKPDVVTLDVEMPKMDGITFLKKLMRLHPLPVVMISTLTEAGATITLDALDIGAVDFVAKPKIDLSNTIENYAEDIIQKVKTAAKANIKARDLPLMTQQITEKLSADAVIPKKVSGHVETTEKIVAIGASTGGTEAIKTVLQALPADFPSIVITQHIPIAFSKSFAERIDRLSALTVCHVEEDRMQLLPGHAYIAPGDKHLIIERKGGHYFCRLNDGPAVGRHKPSVDVMFRSVAQNVGKNAIGVMLTGMGDDGAEGLLEMKQAGATTFVQDEKTSIVWGMPGAAIKLGAAKEQVPIELVAEKLLRILAK